MHFGFSKKVYDLEEKLKPYLARYKDGTVRGGLKPDAPPEAQKLFEEYKKQVEKESWLD